MRTDALTKTIATSFPFAAVGPSVRSLDSEEVIVAFEPTKEVIASIGATVKSRK